MSKQKIRILIPLLIISGLLLLTWIMIITSDWLAVWQHYIGLLLFIPLVYFFFKDVKRSVLWTGVYLLLGTCRLLAFMPMLIQTSMGIRTGSLTLMTPSFQPIPFIFFIVYALLNFDVLANMYLDYKETKAKTKI